MRLFCLSLCFALGACSSSGLNLAKYPDPSASIDEFIICHGYGCSNRTYAWFTPKQWQSVKKIFSKNAAKSPEKERKKIAQAIAKMEKYVGALTATDSDLADAPILKKSDYELDCIDETVNTSKYLQFLYDADLLKFHSIGRPAFRSGLINGKYPHNAATIIEDTTNISYVVDSYVYANGHQPDIRELSHWKKYTLKDLGLKEDSIF